VPLDWDDVVDDGTDGVDGRSFGFESEFLLALVDFDFLVGFAIGVGDVVIDTEEEDKEEEGDDVDEEDDVDVELGGVVGMVVVASVDDVGEDVVFAIENGAVSKVGGVLLSPTTSEVGSRAALPSVVIADAFTAMSTAAARLRRLRFPVMAEFNVGFELEEIGVSSLLLISPICF